MIIISAMSKDRVIGSGDTYFPEFDTDDWDVVERRDHEGFEFVHYQRQS
jgi:dihydrofolate reductase